jgi:hypothetical protein
MEQEIKKIIQKLSTIETLLFIIVIYLISSMFISFGNHYIDLRQKSILLQLQLQSDDK